MINVLPILRHRQTQNDRDCAFCRQDKPIDSVIPITSVLLIITSNDAIPELKFCFYCATNLTAQLSAQIAFLEKH